MLAGDILILTGPPGSGKTTLAGALACEPGIPKVHLHTDDFWHFIKTGAIAPYLPEAHRQNAVVIDVIAKAALGYASGGYFVVVDGIIGPWFLRSFAELPASLHYIVLRPPLELAVQRCHDRGGNTLRDAETVKDLYGQFSSLGAFERHVVLTGKGSPQDVVNMVKDAVRSGKFRLAS